MSGDRFAQARGPCLASIGGFSGYELLRFPALDIYSISSDKWHSVQLQPYAVAVLYHGERDASSLGHAGAGTFWNDVWLLTKDAVAVETEGWAWRKIVVEGKNLPEGRGWFPSASWVDDSGNSHIVMHGGLLSSNERSDELWELRIN
ncbi:Epithiospecifier protein [Grifola frondosa]|uniref:Epithiospecifier protein n=1 Tax=Grifola frondosa TaxID=5627 RepID=A0A1C7MTT6_GRIFR|nr:Epithiospecifier protein [Grifola frondosa]